MNRKLEDVSHFFLDTGVVEPSNLSAQGKATVRRLLYVISTSEAVPGAIVAAGFAAIAAHRGKRVLAAEAQGRPFGVLFALGADAQAGGYRMPILDTPCGVRVLASPLSGARLPRFCVYPEERGVVQEQWQRCELVVVHIEKESLDRAPSELTPPDDCVIVASESLPDGQSEAYQTIKRLLLWKPDVRLALIASGESDGGPPLRRVKEAVSGFLRRDCVVLGRIAEPAEVAAHFLAGGLLGRGWAEVRRVLEPMVSRWMTSPVSETSRDLETPLWSSDLGSPSHLPGRRPRVSTALTAGPGIGPAHEG